jgi:uncharacterized protein (DUF169 family)
MQDSTQRLAEAIDRYIRPGTYPVAVRLLRRDEEVPAGYQEPAQAYGQRIALCQAAFLARRLGAYIVVAEQDQACPAGHIAMGFAEPPAFWLEGHFDLAAGRTSTLEAAAAMAGSVFRFQPGEYSRVAFAPIHKAAFEPDLVLIYGNTLQATMLGMGARHKDGEPLRSTTPARFGCADSIVKTVQTRRCHLVLPSGGDRRWAAAQSDEIVFAAPAEAFLDIAAGLDSVFGDVGTLHPSPVGPEGWLGLQTQLPGKYDRLSQLVGLAPADEG